MKTPIFTGCATAMVTPYTQEGIDFATLEKLLRRQVEGGVSAVLMCATTGEAPTLTEAERRDILRFTVQTVSGRAKVLMGIGSNNTAAALGAALEAEDLGADGVLLTSPYYNKATPEGLYRHFTYVADRCGLPLIVYNVPGRTGIGCTPELYKALAEHPRINGVKEASGSVSLAAQTLHGCGDALIVWSGNDDQTLPMMALGAKGVISVASNLVPAEISRMCAYALSGDSKEALRIHEKYAGLFEQLFMEVNPIPVKTALSAMELCPHFFRLPMCPMTTEHRSALINTLRTLSLL